MDTFSPYKIETIPWHLFLTDDGWMEAEDLQAGDAIVSLGGVYGTVDSIVIETATQTMYDLTVEDVHNFAVGEGDWVVHNCLSVEEASDLALSEARSYAAELRADGRIHGVVAAAVDVKTGEVQVGASGDISSRNEVQEPLQSLLPSRSLNDNESPPHSCGEVSACDNALLFENSNLGDLVVAPVWVETGNIANMCPNCESWTPNVLHVVQR